MYTITIVKENNGDREISIQDNTFAAACYNDNSIDELKFALADGPDEADMAEWGLNESEWRENIILAINALMEGE